MSKRTKAQYSYMNTCILEYLKLLLQIPFCNNQDLVRIWSPFFGDSGRTKSYKLECLIYIMDNESEVSKPLLESDTVRKIYLYNKLTLCQPISHIISTGASTGNIDSISLDLKQFWEDIFNTRVSLFLIFSARKFFTLWLIFGKIKIQEIVGGGSLTFQGGLRFRTLIVVLNKNELLFRSFFECPLSSVMN